MSQRGKGGANYCHMFLNKVLTQYCKCMEFTACQSWFLLIAQVQEIYHTSRPLAVPEVLCAMTKSYRISIIFSAVFLFLVCLVLALCIWNVCLVSDICIRLWAVIGAQREPYCPARWVDICNYCFVLLGKINNNDDDDSWMPHLVIINL